MSLLSIISINILRHLLVGSLIYIIFNKYFNKGIEEIIKEQNDDILSDDIIKYSCIFIIIIIWPIFIAKRLIKFLKNGI